ncbi:ribonuclease PH [Aquibaculum arenosum]|uniref:Ribonuclease PH n=1 Tax=Aquibaculum arenosum TaxID=3032591 RepID=A0ABT5YJM0_9PROT|nr:ribonuclease PH [Fodinicurvata sp. CAU 1616]MDF2095067.1 ribonuclease PH [Fodinicurvata sp. CAU 1616]
MPSSGRPSGRAADALRSIDFQIDVNKYAEGSCLISFGDTRVLCTASIEQSVPGWLRNSGRGWVTAEYGMLPRATDTRTDREAARGKQSGRTQEIQRLVGRSLRAVTDLKGFGERQIRVDCDVLQADGGTRTAAITGSYVALHLAFEHMRRLGAVTRVPLLEPVAAISCGLYQGAPVLDLDYAEDSQAEADANFVITASGQLVEVQATAEKTAFRRQELDALLDLAEKGVGELVALQREVLGLSE